MSDARPILRNAVTIASELGLPLQFYWRQLPGYVLRNMVRKFPGCSSPAVRWVATIVMFLATSIYVGNLPALTVNLIPGEVDTTHYANTAHSGSFSALKNQNLEINFSSAAGSVSIDLRGFGIDYPGEVTVRLDGGESRFPQAVGNYAHGAIETLKMGTVGAGDHTIVIANENPNYTWGVTDLKINVESSLTDRSLNILDFGAIPLVGNDDTSAFNAAIDYANSHGEKTGGNGLVGFDIHLPAGVYDLPIGLKEISVDNVHFSGDTSGGTFIKAQTGTLFHYNGSAGPRLWVVGGGIRDITIVYGNSGIKNATIIKSSYSARQTYENIRLRNAGTIADLGTSSHPSAQQMFRNITGWVADIPVPAFKCTSGSGLFISDSNLFVQNVPTPPAGKKSIASVNRDFMHCTGGGWDTGVISNVITNRFYRGIYVFSNSGLGYSNFYLSNFVSDYNGQNAIRIKTNGGVANSWSITNSWLSSTDSHAMHIDAQHRTQINNIKISNSDIRYSGGDGIRFEKVNDSQLSTIYSSGQGRLLSGSAGLNLINSRNSTVIGGQFGRALNLSGKVYQAQWGVREDAASENSRFIGTSAEGTKGRFSLTGKDRTTSGITLD